MRQAVRHIVRKLRDELGVQLGDWLGSGKLGSGTLCGKLGGGKLCDKLGDGP